MKERELDFVHIELKRESWLNPQIKANNVEAAVRAVQNAVCNLDREMMVALFLTEKCREIDGAICSIGVSNKTFISEIEIMRIGLLSGASRIILLHNHPSGCCEPSKEDLYAAKKVATAGWLMDLQLLDFIIVGDDAVYSVCEQADEWLQPDAEILQKFGCGIGIVKGEDECEE